MNLLLLLLIITAIIIGIHLYNKYFNYSVHDGINIEIAQNLHVETLDKNYCSSSDKFINAYLHKNNILNLDSEPNYSSDYIDILMADSNLNIEIPTHDNPNCIGSNHLTNQVETKNKDKTQTKKIIDLYLRANSTNSANTVGGEKIKLSHFELTDNDLIEDGDENGDEDGNGDDGSNLVNDITDVNNYNNIIDDNRI